jgi:hypothetical protein
MRKCFFVAVLLSLVQTAYAQGRSGGGIVRLNVEAGTVKGAPYSADVINESTQTLADGNRIVHKSVARVFRDSEGRVRREEDRGTGSPVITISDPIAGASWTLDVDNRTARQMPGLGRIYNLAAGRDDMERLTVVLNGLQTAVTAGGRGWIVGPGRGGEQNAEEHPAPRTIEGLRVEGVRRTSTIAAGAIGNERAIVATTEEWTSPDLKTLVLSEHSDPRTGTSTYKLVNVKRGDPPASLFQVPSDFTIVQGPAGVGGRGVAERPGGARGRQ